MRVIMRSVLVIFFGMMILPVFADTGDELWKDRHNSAGAKKVYEHYKQAYTANPDYETSWKFSRAAYHYADTFVRDGGLKKTLFTEGKLAGEKAVSLKPQGVEGHMYLGTCLGSWAKANGILSSLRTIPVIFEHANKAIAINPSFVSGGPYLLRGNVYMKAPKSKGGDLAKAESDFSKAIALFPDNRRAYKFYAELLIKMDKKDKAREIIQKGLNIPYDSANKSSEDLDILELKDMQKTLQ